MTEDECARPWSHNFNNLAIQNSQKISGILISQKISRILISDFL